MSAKPRAVCGWRLDHKYHKATWDAACGFMTEFDEDRTPHEYGWSYCPRCGKAIEVKR